MPASKISGNVGAVIAQSVSDDTAKTVLIRAIEHVSKRMWSNRALWINGIPISDPAICSAVDILRKAEMGITPSFAWCCLPWSEVVARSHREMGMTDKPIPTVNRELNV